MPNQSDTASTQTIPDAACTVCGCVCDDLAITVQGDRIVEANGACELAQPWFAQQNTLNVHPVTHRGVPIDWMEGIQQAADILRSVRYPLIYGLSRSSTEGQRAAVELADAIGACIDTTASEGHAASILALQETGESTCSLGEVRNRSDLVVFWGADPVRTHPRHLERYSLFPTGQYLSRGRDDRTLIVIDSERTATAELADLFVQIPRGRDLEALWTLRLLIKGMEPRSGSDTGVPISVLEDLAQRLKSCRYGIAFFGYGLARQPLGHRIVEALLRLTIELNAFTRFQARRLRVLGNVSGADNVLCWQTGFPFAVNLSRGYPRYNPGEYSAAELLARGEPDAALLVGSDRVERFSAAGLRHLARIPTILLDHAAAQPLWSPTLRFNTAVYGVHRPGVAYRMDDVPIPLRPVLPCGLATDAEVLTAILGRMGM